MSKLNPFRLFGQDDQKIEAQIQAILAARSWDDLDHEEKVIAFRELKNRGWLKEYSQEVLKTIEYLNSEFLRVCPGKNLHKIQPKRVHNFSNENERIKAALLDFEQIFFYGSQVLVFRMLTKFAQLHIDTYYYDQAEKEGDDAKKKNYIASAFYKFDPLAQCLNHIFKQFNINVLLIRTGLVPRQDERIMEEIYKPTMGILEDPKWKPVNRDLSDAFKKFQEKTPQGYSSCITNTISALQAFLQILVRNGTGKGKIDELVLQAQKKKLIPQDPFSSKIFKDIESILMAERQKTGDPHPKKEYANEANAKLMMNLTMVFMQHCLIDI